MNVQEITPHIYLSDSNTYDVPGFGACYILKEDKVAIVDPGPTTSASNVIAALKTLKLEPADVDYLLITHIHLDHAGGAGHLLQFMPRARVYVHQNGARHLINPARLVASMKQAMASENAMEVNGEMVPVPENKVQIALDGDKLKLSEEQTLVFLDGQGHSQHELCIWESRNQGVFVGDAVGNYDMDYKPLLPVTPPPNFDYELFLQTLDRLEKLNARYIYFAHFGFSSEVSKNLELARQKLYRRKKIADEAAQAGKLEEAWELIKQDDCRDIEPMRRAKPALYEYFCDNTIRITADGFLKNYRERFLSAHS